MKLFEITRPHDGAMDDTFDMTKYLEKPDYKVSRNRSYSSWTDCNYKEHRSYISDSVSGEMVLTFVTKEDGSKVYDEHDITLDDFLDMFKSDTGVILDTVEMRVYSMNTGEYLSRDFYWNISVDEIHEANGRVVHRVTLEISEAPARSLS